MFWMMCEEKNAKDGENGGEKGGEKGVEKKTKLKQIT